MRRLALVCLLILISGCVGVQQTVTPEFSYLTKHEKSPERVYPWNPFEAQTPVEIAEAVIAHVTYKSEAVNFWQHPALTFVTQEGDCEDFALLMVSAMMAEGINAYVVRGDRWYMTPQPEVHGHAWVGVIWRGDEYWIDSTSDFVALMSPDDEYWDGYYNIERIQYIDGQGYYQ